MDKLGANITARRIRCGLDQSELAERVGRTSATISYIENDLKMPSVELLANIAKVLDSSVDELLGNERVELHGNLRNDA